MALLFRQYENEIIDFSALIKGLIYKKSIFTIFFSYTKKHKAFKESGGINE